MTEPQNGSRRYIDAIILDELKSLKIKLDALHTMQLNVEHRITKLETHATIRGMLGGAITTAITVVAGVLVWLWQGGTP